jgi:hypothetical protein
MTGKLFSIYTFSSLVFFQVAAADESNRWWPLQAAPRAVVRTAPQLLSESQDSSPREATHMLVQSLAGLAAQAVNAGKLDELVWVNTSQEAYEHYLKATVHRLGLEQRGEFTPWQLLERYRDQGIVRGYVLYRFDRSLGRAYRQRESRDDSVNVATTMAGLLQGVLIDESQVAQAEQLGLRQLFDARDKPADWCLSHQSEQLNRRLLLIQDPKEPRNRDMAIAHRCIVGFGQDEPIPTMMQWLAPLSPIMGWNVGDEFTATEMATRYGHFQTASNFATNLTFLSAASEQTEPKHLDTLDPESIDYNRGRHFVSFFMTDGDNVQWTLGNFLSSRDRTYWDNPLHGRFPFGWTTCTGHLAQLCPPALDLLTQTKPLGTSLIEYNGGYYYPDLFGASRLEPDLLRRHARRMAFHQARSGIALLGFICHRVASEDARRAYQVFAEEIPGLTGMISVQYAPYEGGGGEVYWVADRTGAEIPVATPRFSIWGNTRSPGAGTPAKVACLIDQQAATAQSQGKRSYSLVAVHAWSKFREAAGDDEQAENVPQDGREGVRGLAPVAWCIERLGPEITVVSPEELIWRMRNERRSSVTPTTPDRSLRYRAKNNANNGVNEQ